MIPFGLPGVDIKLTRFGSLISYELKTGSAQLGSFEASTLYFPPEPLILRRPWETLVVVDVCGSGAFVLAVRLGCHRGGAGVRERRAGRGGMPSIAGWESADGRH